jgi:long-subunit acyl-CoA synthetase (AMP-forming)
VKQGVRILPIYGLTETGCAVLYDSEGRKPEDWAWFELADHIKPRWIEHGDGMYELQLLSTEQCVLARTDLPDVSGYATQDLFKRHPERKELYRPVGRIDDVLMLSNGEKVVPSALEGALLAHPLVKGALVFGRGHEQIGVLVEPKEDDKMSADQFKKEIW